MYRFAPSPTGDLHISSLRIALFNYICAKQKKEKFAIRIDDIDYDKKKQTKESEIIDTLLLFGIKADEIVYQSHNLKFHQQLATKLLMDKNAFSCFCTPETIAAEKEAAKKDKREYRYSGRCENLSDAEVIDNENPFVVRAKQSNHDIKFYDIIHHNINFDKETVDSFIILKVNKYPTYNFACSLDDMLMDINVVIRDIRYLNDTPKQILIREYLKYDKEIKYAHIPSINIDKKLKDTEDNVLDVKWLLNEGFLPSAIVNYLIILGNKTPKEIFSLDEAIEWFDLKNISNSPVSFNIEDLKQINKEHIKKENPMQLAKYVGFSSTDVGELVKIFTQDYCTINEIKAKIDTIFAQKECIEFKKEFEILKNIIQDAPFFEKFDDFKNHLSSQSGLSAERLLKPLNVLLTGEESTTNLSDIYPHIKNYLSEIAK